MEITKLSEKSLRIKAKKGTFLIDVTDLKKTEANAYLFLKEDALAVDSEAEGLRIFAPGDYEISGSKISGVKDNNGMYYEMITDGIRILFANASTVSSAKDKINEQQVLLLYADTVIDQSAITNLSPVLICCYGEKAKELSTSLGNGASKNDSGDSASGTTNIKPVDKISFLAEKLPAELEVVLLT